MTTAHDDPPAYADSLMARIEMRLRNKHGLTGRELRIASDRVHAILTSPRRPDPAAQPESESEQQWTGDGPRPSPPVQAVGMPHSPEELRQLRIGVMRARLHGLNRPDPGVLHGDTAVQIGGGLLRSAAAIPEQIGGAIAAYGQQLPGAMGESAKTRGHALMGWAQEQKDRIPRPQGFWGETAESVLPFGASILMMLAARRAGGGPGVTMATGAASAGAQSGGATYSEAYTRLKDAGASDAQASEIGSAEAIGVGVFSAITNTLPFMRYVSRVAPASQQVLMRKIQQFATAGPKRRLAGDMVAEGTQEGTEAVAEMFFQWWAEDDPTAFDNWQGNVLKAAAGGAVLAPLGGGAFEVLGRPTRAGAPSRGGEGRPLAPVPLRGPETSEPEFDEDPRIRQAEERMRENFVRQAAPAMPPAAAPGPAPAMPGMAPAQVDITGWAQPQSFGGVGSTMAMPETTQGPSSVSDDAEAILDLVYGQRKQEEAPRGIQAPPASVLEDAAAILDERQQAQAEQDSAPTAGQTPEGWTPRKRPMRGPVLTGRAGKLRLGDGTTRDVVYEAIEADDAVPSHMVAERFRPDPDGDRNERPYHDPTEGQASRQTVQNIANDRDPLTLLTDTPSVTDGPSVATSDYRILGGNARAMGIQLGYSRGTRIAKPYRDSLIKRAEMYGLDPKAVAKMRNPMLVRRLVGDVGKPGDMSRLLNEDLKAAKTSVADSVSRGRLVDESAMIGIAEAIGDEGDSVRDALADPQKSMRVVSLLRESGAFTDGDLTAMLENSPEGRTLTESGKDTIERTLLGAAVGDVRAMAGVAPRVRRKLVRALGPLVRLRRVRETGFSLDTVLTNAMDALVELRDSGLQSVVDLARQDSLLNTPWRKDMRAVLFADSLLNDGVLAFTAKMRAVQEAADATAGGQAGFDFGQPKSVGEAFDDVFGIGRQDADRQPGPEIAPVEQGAATEAKPARMGDIDPATGKMVLQESHDLATLVKQAAAKEGEYLALLVDVARAAGIPKSQGPRVKSELSVARKVAKFKGRRSPATFSDYLGARVGVSRPEQVAEMLKDLESRGNRIIQKEDFIAEPKEETGGYRAVHVQVDIGDGFSAELEIVPGPIFRIQEITHLWYDVTRVVLAPGSEYSDSDKAQAKELQALINQTMLDAYEAFEAGESGLTITPEAALKRVPDQFIPIIAEAKGIFFAERSASALRRTIAKSVSRTIANIRTIGREVSREEIRERMEQHAQIPPLPDVNPKTVSGAMAIINHLGITSETLKEPWWSVGSTKELAQRMANAPGGGDPSMNTYSNPLVRDAAYQSDDARHRLSEVIVEQMVSAPRLADENEYQMGNGGGVPAGDVRYERTAWLVIGGPGAGKSGLVNTIADSNGAVYISADIAKRLLPEFQRVGAGGVHVESTHIARRATVDAADSGANIIIERTGRSLENIMEVLDILRPRGYRVKLVLVDLPRNVAMVRVLSRFTQTGRLISPAEVYERVGNKPLEAYNEAIERGLADEYEAYRTDKGKPERFHAQQSVEELPDVRPEQVRDEGGQHGGTDLRQGQPGQDDATGRPRHRPRDGEGDLAGRSEGRAGVGRDDAGAAESRDRRRVNRGDRAAAQAPAQGGFTNGGGAPQTGFTEGAEPQGGSTIEHDTPGERDDPDAGGLLQDPGDDRPGPTGPGGPGDGGVPGGGAVRDGVSPGQPGSGRVDAGDGEADGRGERPVPPADSPAPGDDPKSDGAAGSERHARSDRAAARPVRPTDPADRNHVIAEGDTVAPAGNVQKFRANIAAVRLLKTLEEEGRNPTPDEKKVLAAYTGWGWAGEYFSQKKGSNYAKQRAELEELLTPEEFASARRSTTNAHYTSLDVIRPMWELARRLGFKGGRVLEPAMGIGHFFGTMPADLAGDSRLVGVELDSLSGRIATKLYPEADVRVAGFQDTKIANNSIDLAISNVPFGSYKITGKDYDTLLIHDYFFARTLDKLKPGGILIYITSDGTMNKLDSKVRRMLAERADLVGAVRLPNNAFAANAGTQVTTDIVILRKKTGDEFAHAQPWLDVREIGRWDATGLFDDIQARRLKAAEEYNAGALTSEDASEKQAALNREEERYRRGLGSDGTLPILVNEYFAAHPEMALGKHTLAGTMYAAADYALVAPKSQDTAARLREAVAKLPADIMGSAAVAEETGPATIDAEAGAKQGAYLYRDNQFVQVVGEEMLPADWLTQRMSGDDWTKEIDADTRAKRIKIAKDWMHLRQATRELLAVENTQGASDADLARLRRALNRAYDAYVKEHGTLNRAMRHLQRAFFLDSDPDYPLLLALESEHRRIVPVEPPKKPAKVGAKRPRKARLFREEFSYSKGAIFTRRVREPIVMPTSAPDINEALNISMAWKNRADIDLVASLLNITPEEALRQALNTPRLYQNPTSGQVESREVYLSGNVRQKLEEAKAAAAEDPAYERNVAALEAVQPEDVTISDIEVSLASRWMPTEITSAFASELMDTPINVTYIRAANLYSVAGGSSARSQEFAVDGMSANAILAHALNGTNPVIKVNQGTSKEPKMVVDTVATAAAQRHRDKMNEQFVSWLRTSDVQVEAADGQLHPVQTLAAKEYNRRANSIVPPTYDGTHLALPGVSSIVNRLPHRMSVIARIIQEGAAVMAHGVGSGKTFSQIVAAMELRRLGIARKPMIVVQKATIGQFARSFREAYPDARILVANEQTFSAKNRKRLMAQVALGDWDAVIVTQPQFDLIKVSDAKQSAYYNKQIWELDSAISHAAAAEGKRAPTVKRLESMRETLLGKLKKVGERIASRADNTLDFEELGVDFLMVDEAHAYKRAMIVTRKVNVKGVPSGGSDRAFNLMLKLQHIQEPRGGRGAVLATGTPITNTMAEAYVMLKLATPRVLTDVDIDNFDAFADTFAQTKADVERTWSGTFKMVTRLKKLVNGPELVKMIRTGFDVKMGNEELGLKVPKIIGGKPAIVVIPQTPASATINDTIMSVADAWENMEPRERAESSWVPLVTMGMGMAGSLDPRLVDPALSDDPGSKVNTAVGKVLEIYKASAATKGTQIIFADRFKPVNVERLMSLAGGGRADAVDAVDVDMTAETDAEADTITNDDADADESAASRAEDEEYAAGGFNLYHDIKAKLIAQGVPEHEIAIIHDFNTDKTRAQLFMQMNSGDVRILLGSTEKAGVGVNVQELLVAVHHLDPPRSMTPAMMEQRNGRIIRQGNTNESVHILQYGVEASMDANIYQMLETKQRFITQLLSGKAVGRQFNDPADEILLSMAEMKAMVLGDDRIIRQITLRKELDDLRNEREGVERQISSIRTGRATSRERVALMQKRLADAERTLASAQRIAQAPMSLEFEGKKHEGDDAKKALADLMAQTQARAKKAMAENRALFGSAKALVKINGAESDVKALVETRTNRDTGSLYQEMDTTAEVGPQGFTIRFSVPGALWSGIERYAKSTGPAMVDSAQADLARARAEQKKYDDARLPTFENQPKLVSLEKQLERIERSLIGKETDEDKAMAPHKAPPPRVDSPFDTMLDTMIRNAEERLAGYSIGRPGVSRRGASLPPQAFLDAALVIGLKGLRAGVRGGRALTRIVDAVMRTHGDVIPGLVGHAASIRRIAAKWLKTANTPEDLERLHAEGTQSLTVATSKAGKRRAGKADAARRKAAAAAHGPRTGKEPPTIRESDALRDRLRTIDQTEKRAGAEAVRIVRKAQRQARAVERAIGKQKLWALRTKFASERKRLRQTARIEARGAADAQRDIAAARQAVIEGLRQEAIDLTREYLPPEARGTLFQAAQSIRTMLHLSRYLNRLRIVMAKHEGRKTVNAMVRLIGSRDDAGRAILSQKKILALDMDDGAGGQPRHEVESLWGKVLYKWDQLRRLTEKSRGHQADALLDDIRDSLAQIKQLLGEQEIRDRDADRSRYVVERDTRDEMMARQAKAVELPRANAERAGSPASPGAIKRFIRRYATLDTLALIIDRDFSGKGPAARLHRRMVRAETRSLELQQRFRDGFERIVQKYGAKDLASFLAYTSGTLGASVQRTVPVRIGGKLLTVGQAMEIYAQDWTTQELLFNDENPTEGVWATDLEGKTFRVTYEDYLAIEKALGADGAAMVDEIKAYYDSIYFDGLDAVAKQNLGYHLPKIHGYFGRRRYMKKSDGYGLTAHWAQATAPALDNAGVLKFRTGGTIPLIFGEFGTTMLSRSESASNIVAKARIVRMVLRTLLHPRVRTEINNKLGPDVEKMLEQVVLEYAGGEAAARAERDKATAPTRIMLWASARFARSMTGFNPWTWARNLSTIPRMRVALSRREIAAAMRHALSPAVHADLSNRDARLRERWFGTSGIISIMLPGSSTKGGTGFKMSAKATLRELAKATKSAAKLNMANARAALRDADKAWDAMLDSLRLANLFDGAAANVAYIAYQARARKKGLTGDAAKDWAARRAADLFLRVANTNTLLHSTQNQRDARNDRLWAAGQMFMSDTIKVQNLVVQESRRGRRAALRVLEGVLGATLISMLVNLIRGMVLGDDEERVARDVAARGASEILSLVPLGPTVWAQISDNLIRGHSLGRLRLSPEVPVLRMVDDLGRAGVDIYRAVTATNQDDLEDGLARAAMRAGQVISDLSGTGAANRVNEVVRAVRNWGQ